jgi:hypothetical protein
VLCARCRRPIIPGTHFDLDHTDDRTGYLGPSHRRCNRSHAGRRGRAKQLEGPDGAEDRRSVALVEALVRKSCAWCGELFPQSGKQRYCSARCRFQARDSKRYLPKGTLVRAVCASCGGPFGYRSTTKPRKYCGVC